MRTLFLLCFLFSGIFLDYSETKVFFDELSGSTGVRVARVPSFLSGIFKREACKLIEKDTVSFNEEAVRAISNISEITLIDYSGCDSALIHKLESGFRDISVKATPNDADAHVFFSSSDDSNCPDRAIMHSLNQKSFIIFKGKFISDDEP